MPAADVTVYEAAMKEGWTQDNLEVQFYKDDPLLDTVTKEFPHRMIGEYAVTPVWTGRAGGFTMVPPTGSKQLNTADSQSVNQAKWKWGRAWKQVEIDTASVKQTGSNDLAVASTVDTEVEGAISDTRKQITRQLFLDQTGLICKLKAGAASKTLLLETSTADGYGLGVEAVRGGWLVKNQIVDIGTTANEVAKAADTEITAILDSETAPSITISTEITPAATDYVSIANARLGNVSYEINGFRNIISQTSTLGEISVASEPGWIAAAVDESGGAISRQRVIGLRRKARQRGKRPDWAFTSLKQIENLEAEVFPQVRYQGPTDMDAGDGESIHLGSLKVQGHEDCPEGDFNLATKAHLHTLRDEKPYWVPEKFGNGKLLEWKQGTTFLVSALEYYFQLCVNRRNAFAAMRKLT